MRPAGPRIAHMLVRTRIWRDDAIPARVLELNHFCLVHDLSILVEGHPAEDALLIHDSQRFGYCRRVGRPCLLDGVDQRFACGKGEGCLIGRIHLTVIPCPILPRERACIQRQELRRQGQFRCPWRGANHELAGRAELLQVAGCRDACRDDDCFRIEVPALQASEELVAQAVGHATHNHIGRQLCHACDCCCYHIRSSTALQSPAEDNVKAVTLGESRHGTARLSQRRPVLF
mmetsp:Transcript_60463/g.176761  ORF Transcript_60463/g.176761 Transcript_60463/m.176761 type:complete len:232 (+) Transcript_60463:528-1223(+)